MSKITKVVTVLGFTALLAACGGRSEPQDDAVFVPVTPEPVTTKF